MTSDINDELKQMDINRCIFLIVYQSEKVEQSATKHVAEALERELYTKVTISACVRPGELLY